MLQPRCNCCSLRLRQAALPPRRPRGSGCRSSPTCPQGPGPALCAAPISFPAPASLDPPSHPRRGAPGEAATFDPIVVPPRPTRETARMVPQSRFMHQLLHAQGPPAGTQRPRRACWLRRYRTAPVTRADPALPELTGAPSSEPLESALAPYDQQAAGGDQRGRHGACGRPPPSTAPSRRWQVGGRTHLAHTHRVSTRTWHTQPAHLTLGPAVAQSVSSPAAPVSYP